MTLLLQCHEVRDLLRKRMSRSNVRLAKLTELRAPNFLLINEYKLRAEIMFAQSGLDPKGTRAWRARQAWTCVKKAIDLGLVLPE